MTTELRMRFDPQTVRHLGLKMYSQLPAALAEIISNSYDAYATEVLIELKSSAEKPESILVSDNGIGLSLQDINDKFLVIGRNRREDEDPSFSPPFDRPPTGKKGLGKLALFGIAKTITISTAKDGLKNVFELDYDALVSSQGVYKPKIIISDQSTKEPNGTSVELTNLKRASPFDTDGLMDSLSRIFLLDCNFTLLLADPKGDVHEIKSERKYSTVRKQFEWDLQSGDLLKEANSPYDQLEGNLITAEKPLSPSSGLRGITLFSRGKLVNLPEYFSESESSHFYSYLTGWISVDFIEDLEEDVIATNRQAIVWDDPEMSKLRAFLRSLVSTVNAEWRKKRKKKKDDAIQETTGIDTQQWIKTLPSDVKSETQKIVDTLSTEDALDDYGAVITALHKIVPEYPLLHWRHLHSELKDQVAVYYKENLFGDAADQAIKIYFDRMKDMTGSKLDGTDLVSKAYRSADYTGAKSPKIRLNNLSTDSEKNIQTGQADMSRGVYSGFRNPAGHAPMSKVVPTVFSQLDCLNIMSLVSYLMYKLDGASVDANVSMPE